MHAASWLRELLRGTEDWWFDTTRHVSTGADGGPRSADAMVGQVRDSHGYLPVRIANARAALRSLPIADPSKYTFIDIGSGKGRMLFVAAEFAFTRIIGVEFDARLHHAAERNLLAGRRWRRRCRDIQPVLGDAAEYDFPSGPLVVYLFNPFGPEIMGRMLDNLERSFLLAPRHIVLLMLWPEHADVAAKRVWLRETGHTRRYRLFEAGDKAPAT